MIGRRRLAGALLLTALICSCGAGPTATATPTPRPTPPPTAVPTAAAIVDSCVVGSWISSGGFTGPNGSGLAGLVAEVSGDGSVILNLDNTTPWSPPAGASQGTYTGTAVLRIGTDTTGTADMSMTLDSEQDANVVYLDADTGSTTVPAAGIWGNAVYRCGPDSLSITFDAGAGVLAGSSGSFSH